MIRMVLYIAVQARFGFGELIGIDIGFHFV